MVKGLVVSKKYTILVCRGPECGEKRGSGDVHAQFQLELQVCSLNGNSATLDQFSCFGKCKKGVNVLVRELSSLDNPTLLRLMPAAGGSGSRATIYHGVRPSEVRRIVEEHVALGRRITEFVDRGPEVERQAIELELERASPPAK
jgi:(2Fe-2S) ferredoxin